MTCDSIAANARRAPDLGRRRRLQLTKLFLRPLPHVVIGPVGMLFFQPVRDGLVSARISVEQRHRCECRRVLNPGQRAREKPSSPRSRDRFGCRALSRSTAAERDCSRRKLGR